MPGTRLNFNIRSVLGTGPSVGRGAPLSKARAQAQRAEEEAGLLGPDAARRCAELARLNLRSATRPMGFGAGHYQPLAQTSGSGSGSGSGDEGADRNGGGDGGLARLPTGKCARCARCEGPCCWCAALAVAVALLVVSVVGGLRWYANERSTVDDDDDDHAHAEALGVLRFGDVHKAPLRLPPPPPSPRASAPRAWSQRVEAVRAAARAAPRRSAPAAARSPPPPAPAPAWMAMYTDPPSLLPPPESPPSPAPSPPPPPRPPTRESQVQRVATVPWPPPSFPPPPRPPPRRRSRPPPPPPSPHLRPQPEPTPPPLAPTLAAVLGVPATDVVVATASANATR